RRGAPGPGVELPSGGGGRKWAPATGDLLYRMELRYDDARYRPVSEYDRAAGRLRLGTESRENGNGRRGRERRNNQQQHATIELSPRVPIALDLAFGAGEAEVELGGLALEDVHLSTGASSSRVSFGSPNRVAARRVKVE